MAVGKTWQIAVPITREGGTWGYIKVTFQEEYDSLGNYSTLRVTKMTGSNTIRSGNFVSVGTIYVDGSAWYSWNGNNWVFGGLSGDSEFMTWSGASYPSGLRINHNEDGTKNINVSVNISYCGREDGSWSGNGGTVSNTVALTSIPRASTISATDANIESVSTITVNRKSSAYTHTIKYEFGGLSGYINADGGISSSSVKLTATSIGFTIPDSFYTQIPNAKSAVCTLTAVTYSGDTQIGDAKTCKFTVTAPQEACAPEVSGTVVDTNEATKALTGDSNKLIRFYSNALATITATAKNSASITAKSIAGVAVTENSRTIEVVETGSFIFEATDSRGYSNAVQVDKAFVEYIKLTANMTVSRDDPTSGKATLVVKGDYFNGSFGAVVNTLTVQGRIEGGELFTIPFTLDGNKYVATAALSGLDYQKYHEIEVIVTDKLASVTKSQTLNKGIPNYHMGENDVTYEVPVNVKGALNVGENIKLHSDGEGGNITLYPHPDDNASEMSAWSMDTNDGHLRIFGITNDGAVVTPIVLFADGSAAFGNAAQTRANLGAAPLTTIKRKFGNYGGTTAGNCNYYATAEILYLGESRYLVRLTGKIGSSSTASIFTYGVYTPNVLAAINELYGKSYTHIQRTKTGSAKVYKMDGTLEMSGIGYGYIVDSAGDGVGGFAYDYLAPGRIYTNGGAEGLWPMDAFFGYINTTGYLDVVAEFQCS